VHQSAIFKSWLMWPCYHYRMAMLPINHKTKKSKAQLGFLGVAESAYENR